MTVPWPSWLSQLPAHEGLVQISTPRRFAHDEAAYDKQYPINPTDLRAGQGLLKLAREAGGDTSMPALEVGCGTGLLSLGMVAESPYPLTIFTDPSPVFLRITQQKIRSAGISDERVCLAVLTGEEIDRLPPGVLSLIALRSTLHHVLDVEAFIRAAARALTPGGIFAFQEPCMEGMVMMGAMVQFLPALAAAAGEQLTPEQHAKVKEFSDAMTFYARRDVDKSQAEDKHLFRVDEVMRMAHDCGLSCRFLANTSFDAQVALTPPKPRIFGRFFNSYARYCMSWDEPLLNLFDRHLAPYCKMIDAASSGGSGPYTDGVFVCRKVS